VRDLPARPGTNPTRPPGSRPDLVSRRNLLTYKAMRVSHCSRNFKHGTDFAHFAVKEENQRGTRIRPIGGEEMRVVLSFEEVPK
jgi:hypothetical protein